MLEVEITEASLVYDYELCNQIISKLKNQGVKIALDDFGAGHSSLLQLSKLDFDTIKFDRSLIQNCVEDEKTFCIMKNLANLCKELNISTVTEGIENEEQLNIVEALDLDVIQGYFVSKPLAAEPFAHFVQHYKGPLHDDKHG